MTSVITGALAAAATRPQPVSGPSRTWQNAGYRVKTRRRGLSSGPGAGPKTAWPDARATVMADAVGSPLKTPRRALDSGMN